MLSRALSRIPPTVNLKAQMRIQYQGVRVTSPQPTLATIAGTTTIAQTGAIRIQARNRSGFNTSTNAIAYNLNPGEGLEITLPADIVEDGEDVREIVVSRSDDIATTQSYVLAKFHRYSVDESTEFALPAVINLINDEHFIVQGAVATAANLPGSPVNGMRRSVLDEGLIKEYDSRTSTWETAAPNSFSTDIVSPTGLNGANREAKNISDESIIIEPAYAGDGSEGPEVGFWVVNDTSAIISQGSKIYFSFTGDASGSKNAIIATLNAAIIRFRGYVDPATGVIDGIGDDLQAMPNLDVPQDYTSTQFNVPLPKDLPAGIAVYVSIAPKFNAALLAGEIVDGESIRVYPSFGSTSGTFVPGGDAFGNFVYRDPDVVDENLRRLMPGLGLVAIATPGSGLIEEFSFDGVGQQSVVGFAVNTSGQLVSITGNGTCFVVPTVPTGSAQRAIVGTLDGIGFASGFSAPVTINGTTDLIQINLTYPTKIRDDYPDKIAGDDLIVFNPTSIIVYARDTVSGDIFQFSQVVTPGQPNNTFTIGDIAGTNIGTSLPAVAANFGFHLTDISTDAVLGTAAGVSAMAAGDYEIAIAYEYSNTITAIDHSEINGNILELTAPLSELLANTKFWTAPEADFTSLKTVLSENLTNKESKIVTNGSGELVHVVWSEDETNASDDFKFIQPNDIASGPGRWVVLSGGTGSSSKISLTGNLVLTATSPEVILFTPDADGYNVDLATIITNGYKYFKLINLSATFAIRIRDEAGVFQQEIGGFQAAATVCDAYFIEDEWVPIFSRITQS